MALSRVPSTSTRVPLRGYRKGVYRGKQGFERVCHGLTTGLILVHNSVCTTLCRHKRDREGGAVLRASEVAVVAVRTPLGASGLFSDGSIQWV